MKFVNKKISSSYTKNLTGKMIVSTSIRPRMARMPQSINPSWPCRCWPGSSSNATWFRLLRSAGVKSAMSRPCGEIRVREGQCKPPLQSIHTSGKRYLFVDDGHPSNSGILDLGEGVQRCGIARDFDHFRLPTRYNINQGAMERETGSRSH